MTTLTDPRTDLVRLAADEVDHVICKDCWKPGMPMLCGEHDDGPVRDDCDHPTCPLCEVEWDRHVRRLGHRVRRWLP